MWKLVCMVLLVFASSCASLRQGECRDVECRVLGLDASIPIPFAKGVNIMNVRLGWVESRYTHTYKTAFSTDATDKINYVGNAHRVVKIQP